MAQKLIFNILIFFTHEIYTVNLSAIFIKKSKHLQKITLPQLKKLHKIEQRKNIHEVQYLLPETKICTDQKLISAFLIMQKKMQLNRIIPLFEKHFLPKSYCACYCINPSAIVISTTEFQEALPTVIHHTLLHELRHYQQNLAKINATTTNSKVIQKLEEDAETFATQNMPCFVCSYLLQQKSFPTAHPLGYFCEADYASYLQKNLKNKSLCKAHRNFKPSDLKNLNPEIDFYCGPLKDRTPKIIQPMSFISTSKF